MTTAADQNPVKLAVDGAGGTTALAKALNIRSQAVSQWTRIPAERVIEVEKASGVPRHLLRPDLYPPLTPEAVA